MKNTLLILTCFLISFSQNITVLIGNENDKFTHFEKEMCELFFKSYNISNKMAYKLIFLPCNLSTILTKLEIPDSTSPIFAIYTLSITEERKKLYDFSFPYMINKPMILKSKIKMTSKEINDANSIFGVYKNNMYEPLLIERVKQTKQTYKSFLTKTKIAEALNTGIIDFWYTDYADLWTFNLDIANELILGKQDLYGLMYPKSSKLNKLINISFAQFLKSDDFYNLVKKHFGKAAVNYFQRGLKKSF